MSITLSTQPQGQTYTFNESRLQKIVQAKTLDEAQRMGFFDRMMDRFVHGGAKREAIKQLYDSITSPAPHESQPAGLLTRFHRLRDLADDTQRSAFTVAFSPPDGQGHWACALQVGDTAIHASPPGMRDEPATSYAAFLAAVKTDHVLHHAADMAQAVISASQQAPLGSQAQVHDLVHAKARELADALQQITGEPSTIEEITNELLQVQLTEPARASQIHAQLDQAQIGQSSVLKVLFAQHAPVAVSRLLDRMMQPETDALEVMKEAVKLGRCVEGEVTHDPVKTHLDARLKSLCGQQFAQMGTDQLMAMYQKFISQPILIRPNAAIFATIRDVVSEYNFNPGEAEADAILAHAHPMDYAGDAMHTLFLTLEDELHARGQSDQMIQDPEREQLIGSLVPTPAYDKFLTLHIRQQQAIEPAVRQALDEAASHMPPGSLMA